MKVYAETNFILELALEQTQHEACQDILLLAEQHDVRLSFPAFSLVEALTALSNRQQRQAGKSTEIQAIVRDVGRMRAYTEKAIEAEPATRDDHGQGSRPHDALSAQSTASLAL